MGTPRPLEPAEREPRIDAEPAPEREDSELLGVFLAASIVASSLALAGWVLHAGSTGQPVAQSRVATAAAPARRLLDDPTTLALAQPANDVVIGLAAARGGPVDLMPLAGTEVSQLYATLDGQSVPLARCGDGCFRIERPVLRGTPARIAVTVPRQGKPASNTEFRLPGRLPPAGVPLLRLVNRTMGSLRTVRFRQALSSGTGSSLVVRFAARAPDRLRLETSTGQRAIMIGGARWDWSGGRWVRAPASRLRVPSYSWEGASHARVIGSARIGGKPVQILALANPSRGPAFFRLYVARGGRVLRTRMLAPGHFMIETYRAFNEPLAIEPPQ